jgi:hypothetical protein
MVLLPLASLFKELLDQATLVFSLCRKFLFFALNQEESTLIDFYQQINRIIVIGTYPIKSIFLA